MNFQQIVTTEFGTRAWLALGALPPRQGYAFARWLTRQLYHRKRGVVYRVLYGNQRHVMGPGTTPQQVDLAVAAVLKHAGRVNYDLIRTIRRGEQAIVESIEMGESFWPNFHAAYALGRGVLVCGGHLSNFNLGFLSFALTGDTPVQALSAAVPAGGFDVVRNLRNRGMLIDTEIGAPALKKAMQRLKGGGIALIGVDWPVPGIDDGLPFFGVQSLLSPNYVRLALSADSVLVPLAARWTPERGYFAMTCPPIELVHTGDRDRDIRTNALEVLTVMEQWIRETPDQWLMYHPVWPEGQPAQPATRRPQHLTP